METPQLSSLKECAPVGKSLSMIFAMILFLVAISETIAAAGL